jgi:hypothetical protein
MCVRAVIVCVLGQSLYVCKGSHCMCVRAVIVCVLGQSLYVIQ